MAKTITRQPFLLFGETGGSANFAQFGSLAAGSPLKTKDIPQIQAIAAWLGGWQDAVVTGNAPALEDMNGLLYVFAYEIFYGLQEGIAEWDSSTEYFIGSIVKRTGTFELYGSLVDSNTGNSLPSQTNDANWQFLGYLSDLVFPRLNAKNILINGGMEIWQRATSFSPITDAKYGADGWKASIGGATVAVTREATTIKYGTYSQKVNCSAVGGATAIYVHQLIENYLEYAGKTVSFSAWVYTALTNVKIAIDDGTTVTKSSAHPGDSAWHQLTVTAVVDAVPTKLDFRVGQLDGSIVTGIFYADGAMLVGGSNAYDYIPEDPAVAITRCQRYYQAFVGLRWVIFDGQGSSAYDLPIRFGIPMASTPTMTIAAGTTNAASLTSHSPQANGFMLRMTTDATHQLYFVGNSDDASWKAEAGL